MIATPQGVGDDVDVDLLAEDAVVLIKLRAICDLLMLGTPKGGITAEAMRLRQRRCVSRCFGACESNGQALARFVDAVETISARSRMPSCRCGALRAHG